MRLTRCLVQLSEIVFDNYDVTKDWIKNVVRGIVQPLDVSIRLQPSKFKISKEDCDEITKMILAHPGIDLMVEITDRCWNVSNFVSMYCICCFNKFHNVW